MEKQMIYYITVYLFHRIITDNTYCNAIFNEFPLGPSVASVDPSCLLVIMQERCKGRRAAR